MPFLVQLGHVVTGRKPVEFITFMGWKHFLFLQLFQHFQDFVATCDLNLDGGVFSSARLAPGVFKGKKGNKKKTP